MPTTNDLQVKQLRLDLTNFRTVPQADETHALHALVSYDNVAPILNLYRRPKQFIFSLQYNAGPAYKGREFFFFSNGLKIPAVSSLPSMKRALNRFWKKTRVAAASLP